MTSSLDRRRFLAAGAGGLAAALTAGPLALGHTAAADPPPGYKLEKTIPISGDGGWDYLTVDPSARRVYVSHATRVEVLDADSYEVKGQIADTPGVHGIALATEVGRGFTPNGKANTMTVFDLKTLDTLSTVKTGKNPDAVLYEPATRRVFAFNGGGASATVVDSGQAQVVGTIELGGRP